MRKWSFKYVNWRLTTAYPELMSANHLMAGSLLIPFLAFCKTNLINSIIYILYLMKRSFNVANKIRIIDETYADYKKNVNFQVLGPVGDIVEKWTLYGTYIQDAAFGDLDFSASDPVEITLTLRYDYAILEF